MKFAALLVESIIWLAYGAAGYAALWLFGAVHPALAVLVTMLLVVVTFVITRPLQRIANYLLSTTIV